MRKKPKITLKRLRELVSYDAETGLFTWLKSRRGRVCAGSQAGKLKDGYRRIGLDNEVYAASSLAWFYTHGKWPVRNLWFKDGNRDNAAIANLCYGETNSKDTESMNAYSRKWRAANPESRRATQRKQYYGISPETYRDMLVAQNGVCACCGKPETAIVRGKVLPLCVDHCHDSQEIRGLLCQHCNKMLGHAKDSADTLRAAAAYLEVHASKPKTNVIPLAGRRIAGTKGES